METRICNEVQERIVAGAVLDEPGRAHVMGCAACDRVAAEWLELDGLVAQAMDGATVPVGFADRVMAAIAAEVEAPSFVERILRARWLRLAAAHLGLVAALLSLLRFVLSALLPAASLGGSP